MAFNSDDNCIASFSTIFPIVISNIYAKIFFYGAKGQTDRNVFGKAFVFANIVSRRLNRPMARIQAV